MSRQADPREYAARDFLSNHVGADGVARRSFYSLRKSGWHELGTVVERPLADPGVLDAAGLAWTAEGQGLYRTDMQPVATHKAIVRSDTKAQLGIVGAGYYILQNAELINFMRKVDDTKNLTIETAGALRNGERVWALARIPEMQLVKGEDFSQGYLLIVNSHDGSGAVRVLPTMIRVVCQNTMRMALSKRAGNTLTEGYAIRHTSRAQRALDSIADAYARTRTDFAKTQEAFVTLTGKALTAAAFDAMCAAAFKISQEDAADESGRAKAMQLARKNRIAAILASPTCTVKGTAGSLWAGLQAITEYVDHESRTRTTEGTTEASQRFESANFGGTGDAVKARAWEAALLAV